jgi:hypothetical protein
MIEIKRCNYITGDPHSVSYGLSKIIDFLDTSGRNIIFLSKPETHKTILKHLMKISRKEFKDRYEFESLLNKSTLFRIDLIVVDLWHVTQVSSIMEYKEMLDKVGIDYIVVSNKYHYKEGDDICVYNIERQNTDIKTWNLSSSNLKIDKFLITDKIGGWSSTIDDLIISYRRDKKIDDIFGDD